MHVGVRMQGAHPPLHRFVGVGLRLGQGARQRHHRFDVQVAQEAQLIERGTVPGVLHGHHEGTAFAQQRQHAGALRSALRHQQHGIVLRRHGQAVHHGHARHRRQRDLQVVFHDHAFTQQDLTQRALLPMTLQGQSALNVRGLTEAVHHQGLTQTVARRHGVITPDGIPHGGRGSQNQSVITCLGTVLGVGELVVHGLGHLGSAKVLSICITIMAARRSFSHPLPLVRTGKQLRTCPLTQPPVWPAGTCPPLVVGRVSATGDG